MCGMNGVMLVSSCVVVFLYSYIDYLGVCDDVDLQISVIISSREIYYNCCCKIVEEYVCCFFLECESQVIFEGSCCLICGKKCFVRVGLFRKNFILFCGCCIQQIYFYS